MNEKNNATCSICGREYYKCFSCKDMMKLNPWKQHTCTSEHYKIYQVIHGFNTKVYSKDEAKTKLQMVDLSDFDTLRDNIKDIINNIMGVDKTLVDEPIVENIIEPKVIDLSDKNSISDENVEDIFIEEVKEDIKYEVVAEKPKVSRKRKTSEIVEEISSEIVETE